MEEMDLNNLIEQTAQMMIERLDDLGLNPEEQYNDSNVIRQFAGIAASQLTSEGGLEGPDPNHPIPLDDRMLTQGLILFCEGLYNGLAKCAHMGITGQIKQEMIQKVAMHIYEQAKQVVAATYGQEHTPEFQFSHEQQVDIVNKAAEGYLLALVTEHENEFGPIGENEDDVPSPLPNANAPSPKPQAAPSTQSSNARPAPPRDSSPHEKYAVVALLLTTLPAEQRGRILKAFTAEEQELITYYSYPQHVEQNLDLASVEAHLKKLKEKLQQGAPGAKTQAYKGIMTLTASIPPEKLLSWVKDERPLIKAYLETHYARLSGSIGNPSDGRNSTSDPLPPRIEEILYRYLAKRLTSA